MNINEPRQNENFYVERAIISKFAYSLQARQINTEHGAVTFRSNLNIILPVLKIETSLYLMYVSKTDQYILIDTSADAYYNDFKAVFLLEAQVLQAIETVLKMHTLNNLCDTFQLGRPYLDITDHTPTTEPKGLFKPESFRFKDEDYETT